MSEFGSRLKEERVRLSCNQQEFAAFGGVARNAQSNYEKGERLPDASYLEGIYQKGADVFYVITGKRASAGVSDSVANYVLQEQGSIAEMEKSDSLDVNLMRSVIQEVETIMLEEGISLSPAQKARVIVACYEISLKRGTEPATDSISTAIRAVI